MINYLQNEKFCKPIEQFNISELHCEMSIDQLACICNVIKINRPRKIVEVGVAAGGTTTVIYECARMLDLKCEIYSVDIAENHYTDKNKRCGYVAEDYIHNNYSDQITHQFLLGKYFPEQIDKIGNNIDMLILDSVHALPGEVLDYLVARPFLSSRAVVILHDITLWNSTYAPFSMPTNLLLNIERGIKTVNWKKNVPDIGIIAVDSANYSSDEDLFWLLMAEWQHKLSKYEVKTYRDFYERSYGSGLVEIFDKSFLLNRKKNDLPVRRWIMNEYRLFVESYKKILLYGCGKRGKILFTELKKYKCPDGFIVSEKGSNEEDLPIYVFDELNCINQEVLIIVAAYDEAIVTKLENSKYHWVKVPEEIWKVLEWNYEE